MISTGRKLCIFLFLFVSINSHGGLVTYHFTGLVTDDFGPSSGTLSRPVGELVTGSFSYNPNTWSDDSPATQKVYNYPGFDADITFLINGISYSSSTLGNNHHRISIYDDEYEYYSSAGSDLSFMEPSYTFIFEIHDNPNINTIFDPLSLTDLNIGRMLELKNNWDQEIIGDVIFTINEIYTVSSPSTLMLLLVGILSLIIIFMVRTACPFTSITNRHKKVLAMHPYCS